MAINTPDTSVPSQKSLPKKLKLAFSEAHDAARIEAVFDPCVKGYFDPHSHAVKRLNVSFNRAVAQGSAAFLCDEENDVRTLTMAYHVHVDKNPASGAQPDHTNFGTSLSLIPGYKSSTLVIAALALKEWVYHPPRQTISAGIVPENGQSLQIYEKTLGWEKINDVPLTQSIAAATWRTLPDPSDPSGNTCLENPPSALETVGWYNCSRVTIARQAALVLDVMERGYLSNKRGEVIQVDLSALESAGLTKEKLRDLSMYKSLKM